MGHINIDDILKEMTLEDKALLLSGETFFRTRELAKYGIPHMQLLDGGTGINAEQLYGDWFGPLVESEDNEFTREQLDNVSRYFFEENELTETELELKKIIDATLKQKLDLDKIPEPACYPPESFWALPGILSLYTGWVMPLEWKLICISGLPSWYT